MKDIPLDEIDGILSSPPEDTDDLDSQIDYMRKHLKRPLPDKSIERTKEMLQWWWCWLHMRYKAVDKKSIHGVRVYNLMKKREEKHRQLYYRKQGQSNG